MLKNFTKKKRCEMGFLKIQTVDGVNGIHPSESLPPTLSYCLGSLPPLPVPRPNSAESEHVVLKDTPVPTSCLWHFQKSRQIVSGPRQGRRGEAWPASCPPAPNPWLRCQPLKRLPDATLHPPTHTHTHRATLMPSLAQPQPRKGLHLQTLRGAATWNRQELFLEAE